MDIQISSYAEGKRFVVKLDDRSFASAPLWEASFEYPPLTPRRAIAASEETFGKYIADTKDWQLYEVRIKPIGGGHWIYVVEFQKGGFCAGLPANFIAVVLMCGRSASHLVLPGSSAQQMIV